MYLQLLSTVSYVQCKPFTKNQMNRYEEVISLINDIPKNIQVSNDLLNNSKTRKLKTLVFNQFLFL